MEKIDTFYYDGEHRRVEFVETQDVKPGVVCDVYRFTGQNAYDLALVSVEPGCSTPLQQITGGQMDNRTVEGLLEGWGCLMTSTSEVGLTHQHGIPRTTTLFGTDRMQWRAGEVGLTFFEICHPPYEPGRFVNLTE